MILFDILKYYNIIIGILFLLCYSYQFFYLFSGTFLRPQKYQVAIRQRRFAFCIAARNEERVISQLCESIKKQNYPSNLVDIYVVADNCTDNTLAVAESCGAKVFERFSDKYVGKGYALTFLFNKIKETVGLDIYDGYFIVDADNILDKNYVMHMNNCADAGHRVIMCYRNSKNYGDNWISAGYSLWFLRASRHLNLPRQHLGVSCEVTGTGFYVCSDIICRNGGWRHHCLIEDIEFTIDSVISGEKVAFCYDAIVYDEQPTDLWQSVRQRIRWCRGYFQIMKKYGISLLSRFFRGCGFSNFDMIMGIAPAFIISAISVVVNIVLVSLILLSDLSFFRQIFYLETFILMSAYFLVFFVGIVAGVCEWKRIRARRAKVILYFFTFPIFVASFLPISIIALFSKEKWKPIDHHPTDMEKFDK